MFAELWADQVGMSFSDSIVLDNAQSPKTYTD